MNSKILHRVLLPSEIRTVVAALRVAAEIWERDAQATAEANQDRVSEQFQAQIHHAELLLESLEALGF